MAFQHVFLAADRPITIFIQFWQDRLRKPRQFGWRFSIFRNIEGRPPRTADRFQSIVNPFVDRVFDPRDRAVKNLSVFFSYGNGAGCCWATASVAEAPRRRG
jgi:hypothetical protein